MNPASPVAAMLLTGGRSRRMGQAKAGLPGPDGRSWAQRTGAIIGAVAVAAVEVGGGWSGLPAVPDEQPGAGPLAAVATGTAALARAGWRGPALIVATDLPRLSVDALRWLALHPAPGTVVPVVGGHPQWLCARYGAATLALASSLVAAGTNRMAALAEAPDGDGLHLAGPEEWSPWVGADTWADADTPEDLARLGWVAPVVQLAVTGPGRAVTDVQVVRVRPGSHVRLPDQVVTEEPLEIRAGGPGQEPEAVAVTMRTPGHDFDLAAGFLVTEGLARPEVIARVGYCATVEPELRFNTVSVALREPWVAPPQARVFAVSSSCGVCGKAGIDQIELACPLLGPSPALRASVLATLPDRLRTGQRVFDRTGGLHAAGAFDADGTLRAVREDVGRHNAVDKLVGAAVLAPGDRPTPGAPALAGTAVVVVSGRVSFEIVQKTVMAGVPVLAAVSAPSSLAVQAADRLGLTVVGFVRAARCVVYTHPERLVFDQD